MTECHRGQQKPGMGSISIAANNKKTCVERQFSAIKTTDVNSLNGEIKARCCCSVCACVCVLGGVDWGDRSGGNRKSQLHFLGTGKMCVSVCQRNSSVSEQEEEKRECVCDVRVCVEVSERGRESARELCDVCVCVCWRL